MSLGNLNTAQESSFSPDSIVNHCLSGISTDIVFVLILYWTSSTQSTCYDLPVPAKYEVTPSFGKGIMMVMGGAEGHVSWF